MPERDYTNYWDDYNRDDPYNWDGRPEHPDLYTNGTLPITPPVTPGLTTTPTPTTGGTTGTSRNPQAGPDGSTFPNMDPPGFRGGYWMGGQWVQGSPYSGGPGYDPGGSVVGGPSYAGNWPSYTAPGYLDPGEFDPGPAFTYKDFMAPTGQTMLNEPGFQFRLDQGRKALEASAAGKGVLRSGGTLKDILGYGQNFASQEYGNVYNRALQEYDTNRNNAFGSWQSQYGQRRDVYDRTANNIGQHNTFNLGNAQNDYAARRDAALDEFNRWKAQGDWLSQPDT